MSNSEFMKGELYRQAEIEGLGFEFMGDIAGFSLFGKGRERWKFEPHGDMLRAYGSYNFHICGCEGIIFEGVVYG